MLYIESFRLPSRQFEEQYMYSIRETCYNNFYPFGVFRNRSIPELEFEPITLLYGSNGSGKSTILNVIADRLNLQRHAVINKSSFYPDYVQACKYKTASKFDDVIRMKSEILSSDDIFDYLLNIRNLNAGIDTDRSLLFDEYQKICREQKSEEGTQFRMRSLDDYDTLKKYVDASKGSKSYFTRRNGLPNIAENSNGESALNIFRQRIDENALYLLDEPENSLSAEKQLVFRKYISDACRFFNCQFIIATHSPFFLSIKDAIIYDLDDQNCSVKKWTELTNIRVYFNLFEEHRAEFLNEE